MYSIKESKSYDKERVRELQELERRLIKRGTETRDAIDRRLLIAQAELQCAADYDYIVINDVLEDAVQDVLVKAWEKRNTLRDIRRFGPWITRILSNHCRDMLRKRRKWSFYPLKEDTAQSEIPEPESPVTEAMKKLKPELRTLVTLRYVDGYTVQELADLLGRPSGTVKTRLWSARKQLSRTLLTEWEEEV